MEERPSVLFVLDVLVEHLSHRLGAHVVPRRAAGELPVTVREERVEGGRLSAALAALLGRPLGERCFHSPPLC